MFFFLNKKSGFHYCYKIPEVTNSQQGKMHFVMSVYDHPTIIWDLKWGRAPGQDGMVLQSWSLCDIQEARDRERKSQGPINPSVAQSQSSNFLPVAPIM